VGTAAPEYPLTVKSSGMAARITNTKNAAGFAMIIENTGGNYSSKGLGIASDSTNTGNGGSLLQIKYGTWSDGVTKFYVANNGNVGIGDKETSPDARLDVIRASSGDIINLSSNIQADGDLLTVTNVGNVGIGTTTPAQLLQVFNNTSATTTVEFGDISSSTAKTCFNINQADGSVGSFYFMGGAMVIENNACK